MQKAHLIILALAFVVDLRIGMVLTTVFFAIFSLVLINTMLKASENREPFLKGKQSLRENFSYLPCSQTTPFKTVSKRLGNLDPPYERVNKCNEGISYDCMKYNMDPFKTKEVVVNKSMHSINNALQGGANPKTMIPPMVTVPMYDLQWRPNDLIVPGRLNRRTNENLYLSGYIPSIVEDDVEQAPLKLTKEDYTAPTKQNNNNIIENPFETAQTKLPKDSKAVLENYQLENDQPMYKTNEYAGETWPEQVNTIDGYNRKQWVDSRFPANLPQGRCNGVKELAENHTQLFTQTVQPNVYYRNDVIEPINSNIGISWDQQFLPRTFDYTKDGEDLSIVDHDPNFPVPVVPVNGDPIEPNASNVYDPRFTGYGTSYRNYVDDVTGQPRFPYDDINAVRMPNYVVRSKIDTHDFADKYGSVKTPQSLESVRSKAQDAFMNDALDHRTDLMSRLMRKRNSELWQLRQSPHYTSSGRMMTGGTGGRGGMGAVSKGKCA